MPYCVGSTIAALILAALAYPLALAFVTSRRRIRDMITHHKHVSIVSGEGTWRASAFDDDCPAAATKQPVLNLEEIRHEMIISGSFWRKTFVTAVAAVGFVSFNEVTGARLEVRGAPRDPARNDGAAGAGARLAFSATAYCRGLDTASGVAVQSGIVAADPELLPVGTVIEVDSLLAKHNGISPCSTPVRPFRAVRSTSTCGAATRRCSSGAEPIHLNVLRLGWNPRATTPTFFDRMFKRPEPPPLPVASAAAGCFATCAIVGYPRCGPSEHKGSLCVESAPLT